MAIIRRGRWRLTLSLGTLLIVLSGLSTLRTLRDFIVLRFLPAPLLLQTHEHTHQNTQLVYDKDTSVSCHLNLFNASTAAANNWHFSYRLKNKVIIWEHFCQLVVHK